MTPVVHNINLILSVIGFFLSTLGLIHILTGFFPSRRTKYFFTVFFVTLTIYVLCILLRELTYSYTEEGWVIFSKILFFGQSIAASTLLILITAFILKESGEKKLFRSPIFIASFVAWIIYISLIIITQFTGVIYSVSDNNEYSRGMLYPLLILVTAVIMVLNLVALWVKRNKLSSKKRTALLIYIIVPTIAMVIQLFLFGIHLIELSTVISALITLTYIVTDETTVYYEQVRENDKLKGDVMLSQIQPHFLFNTLITIKSLCREDPTKAEEGIGEFSKFLKYNMDSLTTDSPIPFENELEHVREYLSLQKLRFGEELNVEYDLEYTDFELPTLTLQPLVENAVIHGIRHSATGTGIVTIRTRNCPGHIEVCVEDDGAGFDPVILDNDENVNSDSKSHVGLSNIKSRLLLMCSGSLLIESEPGKGTTAQIILPKKK